MRSIWLHTFEKWGLAQADQYTDQLIKSFEELAAHPKQGQSVDHIRKGYRRSVVGRHAIYYQTMDYGIAVIRVLHDRMLPMRHLGQIRIV